MLIISTLLALASAIYLPEKESSFVQASTLISCGGPNAILKNPVAIFTPNPLRKSDPIVLQVSGTLTEPIDARATSRTTLKYCKFICSMSAFKILINEFENHHKSCFNASWIRSVWPGDSHLHCKLQFSCWTLDDQWGLPDPFNCSWRHLRSSLHI